MTIKIYGASDDLIDVEGCEGADEFMSYEKGPLMWRGDLIGPMGLDAMRVHAVLDHDSGCWSFAVGQADESVPFPEWPLRIRRHTDAAYSVLLELDAPHGTRLENIWPVREDGDG